ncbi:BZ3500_MvSof-1268-A1-R1_Chr8-1g10006 [Microbotryum saponariae]|uniref:BZ3500_MvSof-1268-A1-R1_Chr8-1g10006 protein n=1 Tax=Microbotryum saponariae TaxID=289078 RepID=A0A2X0LJ27_9BASI|nr:BZ3500_MvSof-1268-A1-R1_Chr8-1g10006 [Microbotryum saponariae]SDA08292.1 BZ3501_MvSof-1269-A2-R1_Chr8-1g09729 [Microbotryum saponariae]
MLSSGGSSSLWTRARQVEQLPQLDCWDLTTPIGQVQLANLAFGRTCRGCGKGNARKVDWFLRARLCSSCFRSKSFPDRLVLEGPDEPDPAFAQYFMGTKRYTPRSPQHSNFLAGAGKKWKTIRTFFFEPALAATSKWLSTLFEPVLHEAESQDLEPEDVEDLFERPTEQIRRRLDERQRWVDAIQRSPDSERLYSPWIQRDGGTSQVRESALDTRSIAIRRQRKVPCLTIRQGPKILQARARAAESFRCDVSTCRDVRRPHSGINCGVGCRIGIRSRGVYLSIIYYKSPEPCREWSLLRHSASQTGATTLSTATRAQAQAHQRQPPPPPPRRVPTRSQNENRRNATGGGGGLS